VCGGMCVCMYVWCVCVGVYGVCVLVCVCVCVCSGGILVQDKRKCRVLYRNAYHESQKKKIQMGGEE
jgi:hypothetical protein